MERGQAMVFNTDCNFCIQMVSGKLEFSIKIVKVQSLLLSYKCLLLISRDFLVLFLFFCDCFTKSQIKVFSKYFRFTVS